MVRLLLPPPPPLLLPLPLLLLVVVMVMVLLLLLLPLHAMGGCAYVHACMGGWVSGYACCVGRRACVYVCLRLCIHASTRTRTLG